MKKLTFLSIAYLFFASVAFAEPHLDEAITHATAAVDHGKQGHASVLVEHAAPALEHTLSAATVAHGPSKGHVNNAIADLEEAVKHGKMGHADVATTYAETALEHLKAANK